MRHVTIDRQALKNALRPLLQAAIKARVESAPWQHTNRDAYYSPSQWWADAEHTQRHTLATGISAAVSGAVISITLDFQVNDL